MKPSVVCREKFGYCRVLFHFILIVLLPPYPTDEQYSSREGRFQKEQYDGRSSCPKYGVIRRELDEENKIIFVAFQTLALSFCAIQDHPARLLSRAGRENCLFLSPFGLFLATLVDIML